MDAAFDSYAGHKMLLKETPSYYFPHSDHFNNYIEELEEMADKLSPSARPKVLGET